MNPRVYDRDDLARAQYVATSLCWLDSTANDLGNLIQVMSQIRKAEDWTDGRIFTALAAVKEMYEQSRIVMDALDGIVDMLTEDWTSRCDKEEEE